VAEPLKTDGVPARVSASGQAISAFSSASLGPLVGRVATGPCVLWTNLLAVARALFSLQVYDAWIPHQSEATLWVLPPVQASRW